MAEKNGCLEIRCCDGGGGGGGGGGCYAMSLEFQGANTLNPRQYESPVAVNTFTTTPPTFAVPELWWVAPSNGRIIGHGFAAELDCGSFEINVFANDASAGLIYSDTRTVAAIANAAGWHSVAHQEAPGAAFNAGDTLCFSWGAYSFRNPGIYIASVMLELDCQPPTPPPPPPGGA